ncbi:hypothetical protein BWQ96_04058 [Gracilariopsis chorda]|uniref:Uncharacterized protein n=1 Tax=Gracilariopsis chorda TaxID=448386 RepID=A0A2V3IVP1_9FLOR|nr:hypothetical protein BWQ96_04058 [Gracilariopsis chorda]|eukprot:PXF46181.1 hypothetical protein BWQ96_04058 [Gracilariopsis chorda]
MHGKKEYPHKGFPLPIAFSVERLKEQSAIDETSVDQFWTKSIELFATLLKRNQDKKRVVDYATDTGVKATQNGTYKTRMQCSCCLGSICYVAFTESVKCLRTDDGYT